MKKHYILFLLCLGFGASAQNPSPFINQESLDSRGNTMLLGPCSKYYYEKALQLDSGLVSAQEKIVDLKKRDTK
jgi:hypothetical protein